MAAVLAEWQFEVEDVVFGSDVGSGMWTEPDQFQPGSPEIRDQDVPNDAGDGVRPGQDFYGAANWSWQLYSNAMNAAGALAASGALRAVWPSEALRQDPGAVTALRYRIGGRTRRVYGRPRHWTTVTSRKVHTGNVGVACDFVVFDHRFYADNEQSVELSLSAVHPDTGVVVPFVPPFISTASTESHPEVITVGGEVPTPVIVEFRGPVTRARLAVPSAGWVAQLTGTVVDDDSVTLDARPWAMTSTVASSGGAAAVSPRETRLAELLLPPGQHTLEFTGIDPSGTARVTVRWRDAYLSL